MARERSIPRPAVPAGTASWLSEAIDSLYRYASGLAGAMISERWRFAEVLRNGAQVTGLQQKIDRGWETAMTLPLASFTASWDPPAIGSGAATTANVAAPGAVLGQPAVAAFSVALPTGVILSAAVTAADTVTVTLLNMSGIAQNLGAGTLKVVLL